MHPLFAANLGVGGVQARVRWGPVGKAGESARGVGACRRSAALAFGLKRVAELGVDTHPPSIYRTSIRNYVRREGLPMAASATSHHAGPADATGSSCTAASRSVDEVGRSRGKGRINVDL